MGSTTVSSQDVPPVSAPAGTIFFLLLLQVRQARCATPNRHTMPATMPATMPTIKAMLMLSAVDAGGTEGGGPIEMIIKTMVTALMVGVASRVKPSAAESSSVEVAAIVSAALLAVDVVSVMVAVTIMLAAVTLMTTWQRGSWHEMYSRSFVSYTIKSKSDTVPEAVTVTLNCSATVEMESSPAGED